MSSAMNPRIEGEESAPHNPSGRRKSHDSQNSVSSSSKLKRIMNVFNPWSSQSPASTPPLNTGGSRRVRKIGIKPRSKVARDAVQKSHRTHFITEMGQRRLPRRSNQLRPTAKMIQDARRGHLTKFLRQGDITRADSFGDGMVNPRTAEIYLDYDHDFVTDHLSDESEDMDDELKNEKNLYYISVHRNELPTYHFWQRETDPDPLQARRPIDWGAVFNERLPAVLAEEEREAQLNGASSGGVKSRPADPMVENAWMPGGKYHRELNPKRSVRPSLSNRTANSVPSEPEWAIQGSIAGLVWNSNNNGISEASRQCGPQPGDPEWEAAECEWEARLREAKNLQAFLAQYRQDENEKHAELTAPRTSPVLRPIHANDAGSQRYNAILKTAVPTVAFKLTQLQFGRPVSPLKGNEPMCRGEDPSNWNPGDNSSENSWFTGGKLVYHKDEPLEFLDFYDQKSYGQPMIRLRKPIPEEYIQREPPYRSGIADPFDTVGLADNNPALRPEPVVDLKNAFAASKRSQASATPVLLQGDRGGLYLYEKSYESFLATARRLLPTSIDKGPGLVFWMDFKRVDATDVEAVRIDLVSGPATFETTIKPLFATRTYEFRIRHGGEPKQPFKRSQYTGSSIRLNHKTVGYVYVAVGWVDEPAAHSELQYPSTVMVDAISFLFPVAVRNGIRFTLVIRDAGSHDVDLRNPRNAAVKARLQAILHRVTEENKASADPVEVQIYEAAHPPFDEPIPEGPSTGPVVGPGPVVPLTGTGQSQPPRQPPVPPSQPPPPRHTGPPVPPSQPPPPRHTRPPVPPSQPPPPRHTRPPVPPSQPPPPRYIGPPVPPSQPTPPRPTGPAGSTTQVPPPEKTGLPFSLQPPRLGLNVDTVTLIRPARGGALELTAPFTAQKILERVQELYRPLDHDWTIRVFPTEAAWRNNQYFTVGSEVISNTEKSQEFVAEFQQTVEQHGRVYLYKQLPVPIRVNNGTGLSRTSELWDHNSNSTGANFVRVASILTDNQPGRNPAEIRIRVHRHTSEGENLYWNNTMSEDQFRRDVYYKIDDPEIDIYPPNLVLDGRTFDETRMAAEKLPLKTPEERAKQQKEQEENYSQWLKESNEKFKEYDAKLASRLGPESIYGKDSGEIIIPKYGPSLEPEIWGGLDMPSTYARVLTLSEIERLQTNYQRAENELLQREASCRICDAKFWPGFSDIKAHYAKHKEDQVQRCPFCERNWTTWSIEERTSHIHSAHPSGGFAAQAEVCLDCGVDFSDRLAFPDFQAITIHVKAHRSSSPAPPAKVLCDHPNCGANLSHLDNQGRIDHAKTHSKLKPASGPNGGDGGDGGDDGGDNGGDRGGYGTNTGGEAVGNNGGDKGGNEGGDKGKKESGVDGGDDGGDGGGDGGDGGGDGGDGGDGGTAPGKDKKGTPRAGHWVYCPTCTVRYSSTKPELIAAHAKRHNIKPEEFKRLTPRQLSAIRKKIHTKGSVGNQPQPKDGGSKGTDGKGTDGKATDGKGTDGKGTDGKGTAGKGTDGKGTAGKGTDSKGTDGKGGNSKSGDGKDGGAKPVTRSGGNVKKGVEKGGPGRKKRTRSQDNDDDEDGGNKGDELLNPPYLRSPKRRRGNTKAGNGQPQRQSTRQRRAPVRSSIKV